MPNECLSSERLNGTRIMLDGLTGWYLYLGDKVSGGNRRMLEPAISPQDIQQAEFTVDDDSTSLLEGYHIKSFFQLTPSYHIICKNIHPAKQ